MRLVLLVSFVTWCVTCSDAIPSNKARCYESIDNESKDLKNVVKSIDDFTPNFYKPLAKSITGNFVCSPISVHLLMSMLFYGAGGKTRQELGKVLELPMDVVPNGFREMLDKLRGYTAVTLHFANKMYLANNLEPSMNFKKVTKNDFLAETKNVNFRNAAKAAKEINGWCEAQTDHRIKNVINPNDLNSDTYLILISAVYFKGKWMKRFNAPVRKYSQFHVSSKLYNYVTMMSIEDEFVYGELPSVEAKFVELPYKNAGSNDEMSMIVILPNEIQGLAYLEKHIETVRLDELLRHQPTKVKVSLPKFKIEREILLEEVFRKMGVEDIFDGSADLTGITKKQFLKVGKIAQKVFIEVNEEGSEAAAVSSMAIGTRMDFADDPKIFNADHPFMIIIATKDKTPIPLFIARYTGPNAMTPDRDVSQALNAVTNSAEAFSSKFLKAVAEDVSDNFVCSPISVSLLLSMVTYGAQGNTETQLRTALALPKSDDDLLQTGSHVLIDSFNNYKLAEVRLANRIYLAESLEAEKRFIDVTRRAFRSEAQSVNFAKSAWASRAINTWVEHQTNHLIKDLTSPGNFNARTNFVLVSAIYFNGTWEKQFNPSMETKKSFYVDRTTKKNVSMMNQMAKFRYGIYPEIKATFLQLPFKSFEKKDSMSMFIILPDEIEGLADVENNFDQVTVKELLDRSNLSLVALTLPKFTIESTINLKAPLIQMGMTDMFSPWANFEGITKSRNVQVSRVVQKAFIEINEYGTTAAAAGSIESSFRNYQRTVKFKVNHPFISIIATTGENPVILFAARYRGPKDTEEKRQNRFYV